jgi:hypothetical protein
MSSRFNRGLIGGVIGTLGGASAGGLTFGLDASMYVGSSWIGPTKDWWPLHALFGAAVGAAGGLALGLYISRADFRVRSGIVAGGILGLIGAGAILFLESDFSWQLRSWGSHILPLLLSLICWALIGLVVSLVMNKLKGFRGQ